MRPNHVVKTTRNCRKTFKKFYVPERDDRSKSISCFKYVIFFFYFLADTISDMPVIPYNYGGPSKNFEHLLVKQR